MTKFEQFRRTLSHFCDGLELVAAAAVGVGVLIAMYSLREGVSIFWETRSETYAFTSYLTLVFNLVIGIEFMKMLCRPHTGNIIEILIFLQARHMIVKQTTPLEDLLTVVSICILFFFRRFMLATKPDSESHVHSIFESLLRHDDEFEHHHHDHDHDYYDHHDHHHHHDHDHHDHCDHHDDHENKDEEK